MIKLPISETALKYYEETGYKFSFKEQAHLCYRYIPGLLERNDALREILKESDDEELNKDIRMLIEYGSNIYNMFMDNKDNRCIYYLKTLTKEWGLNMMFRTIEGAMHYVEENVYDDYKIDKIQLFDDCSIDDHHYMSALSFKRGDPDEIIDYWSVEYEDDYDSDEHGPFEERFDNMYMNVDCPFERGDIVVRPDTSYPVIILTGRNIFHERYEASKNLDWTNVIKGVDVIMELDYEDNLIPVLDYHDDFFIKYVRPFDLEKFEPNGHFSESFRENLLYISKMVKSGFNMDKIKREIENMDSYRSEFRT